jgi:hypothetical protein
MGAKMPFPNRDTQIGAPRGPRPGHGRPPGVVLGKKRRRELRRAAALSEAVHGEAPWFDGDSLAFFQSIYRDPSQPTELKLVAARAAAPYERPALAATHVQIETQPVMSREERWRRIRELSLELFGQEIAPRTIEYESDRVNSVPLPGRRALTSK